MHKLNTQTLFLFIVKEYDEGRFGFEMEMRQMELRSRKIKGYVTDAVLFLIGSLLYAASVNIFTAPNLSLIHISRSLFSRPARYF